MGAMKVVIAMKACKLSFQIAGVPEQRLIQTLTANGANQPFDKGMRSWDLRDTFDLIDIQNAKVGIPLMVFEQWLVV